MTTKPMRTKPDAVDESAESEITILPDGRVCAFGITRSLVGLLAALPASDARMKRLYEQTCRQNVAPRYEGRNSDA